MKKFKKGDKIYYIDTKTRKEVLGTVVLFRYYKHRKFLELIRDGDETKKIIYRFQDKVREA